MEHYYDTVSCPVTTETDSDLKLNIPTQFLSDSPTYLELIQVSMDPHGRMASDICSRFLQSRRPSSHQAES